MQDSLTWVQIHSKIANKQALWPQKYSLTHTHQHYQGTYLVEHIGQLAGVAAQPIAAGEARSARGERELVVEDWRPRCGQQGGEATIRALEQIVSDDA